MTSQQIPEEKRRGKHNQRQRKDKWASTYGKAGDGLPNRSSDWNAWAFVFAKTSADAIYTRKLRFNERAKASRKAWASSMFALLCIKHSFDLVRVTRWEVMFYYKRWVDFHTTSHILPSKPRKCKCGTKLCHIVEPVMPRSLAQKQSGFAVVLSVG